MTLQNRTARASILLSAAILVSAPAHAAAREPSSKAGTPASASEPADPRTRVGRANAQARVQPSQSSYSGAIQQYPWSDGALFQVYTAPGQVTDIVLQEGELLVGPGPVASGDTVRWMLITAEK